MRKIEEEWRAVVGYEGRYEVSSIRNVKSLSRIVGSGKGFRDKKEVTLKPHVHPLGYKIVSLTDTNLRSKTFFVHRLVAIVFVENPNDYKEVNHIDHNKENNSYNNLEWCTRKQNVNAMIDFHGKRKKEHPCIECGQQRSRNSNTMCKECFKKYEGRRKVKRPSKEDLYKLIHEKTFVDIGKIYNVTDNAVRSWCKDYDLPFRKKDLK